MRREGGSRGAGSRLSRPLRAGSGGRRGGDAAPRPQRSPAPPLRGKLRAARLHRRSASAGGVSAAAVGARQRSRRQPLPSGALPEGWGQSRRDGGRWACGRLPSLLGWRRGRAGCGRGVERPQAAAGAGAPTGTSAPLPGPGRALPGCGTRSAGPQGSGFACAGQTKRPPQPSDLLTERKLFPH